MRNRLPYKSGPPSQADRSNKTHKNEKKYCFPANLDKKKRKRNLCATAPIEKNDFMKHKCRANLTFSAVIGKPPYVWYGIHRPLLVLVQHLGVNLRCRQLPMSEQF